MDPWNAAPPPKAGLSTGQKVLVVVLIIVAVVIALGFNSIAGMFPR
jgi:hypothetical protein